MKQLRLDPDKKRFCKVRRHTSAELYSRPLTSSKRFIRETRCWSWATQCQSEDPEQIVVVPLLEVWLDYDNYPSPTLVMPWCKEGNLSDYIKDCERKGRPLTARQRLDLVRAKADTNDTQ